MGRVSLVSCLVLGLATGNATAVGKGRTLEYKGEGAAPVFFNGTAHAMYQCNDCHATLFPMKKKTILTHKDMDVGRYCGVCHNGKIAFSTTANCQMCHRRTPTNEK